MKKTKKLVVMLMAFALCLTSFIGMSSVRVFAASASFSISVSSDSIQKGDSVTVTVTLSCSEALGAYSYCLSYDSSILEYTDGSGYGSGGTISYASYGDGNSTSSSASYTFTAISTGSAYIGTGSSDVYTWSEENCSASEAGVTISVSPTQTTTESPTEDTTENATEDTTQSTTDDTTSDTSEQSEDTSEDTTEELSNNCFLSSLSITPGTLEPAFSRETYQYKASVPGETTSLAINAIPEDSKSSVDIEGNSGFEPEKTYPVKIIVTAETGDVLVYEIEVTCEKLVDKRAPFEVDGKTYYFCDDYSKISIPEGFAQKEITVSGKKAIVYVSPNGLITCAYLYDEKDKGNWYIVDVKASTMTPLIMAESSYNSYIILTPDKDTSVPAGYEAFDYKLGDGKNGYSITAYRKNPEDEIILVYAMNPKTEQGWYLYDTKEKTFVRYTFTEQAEVVAPAPTSTPAPEAEGFEKFIEENKTTLLLICVIIMAIMVIAVIVLACVLVYMIRKNRGDYDETNSLLETDDFDDIPGTNDFDDVAKTDGFNETAEADGFNKTAEADGFNETAKTDGFNETAKTDGFNETAEADGFNETAKTDGFNDMNSSGKQSETASIFTEAASVEKKEQPVSSGNSLFNENHNEGSEQSATTPASVVENTVTENTVAENAVTENTVAENAVAENAVAENAVAENVAENAVAENVAENVASSNEKNTQGRSSEELDVIKAAAKYSSLNTADLSAVINMAASIVNSDEENASPVKEAKNVADGINFKPIKPSKSEENTDKK